ncbi:MAG TPA: HyaD/HybD family hydrogenase maturation endopeptidase [Gemmatimonadales bacterium]|nr:HyaD/HybD family hydrogenase maturation endopeptidase [Gemmatimonadales bacterium]
MTAKGPESGAGSPRARAVVLRLGNPLMGDDGLGLVALALLRDRWQFPETVELVDGGTWGMNLLPLIEDADQVVLLDAIRAGAPPGTVHRLERDQLPRYFSHKLSPHQIDLREVLALAELRGTLPAAVVALGAEPEVVEMTTDLTSSVAGRVDELVEAVAAQLAAWGHPGLCRTVPTHA